MNARFVLELPVRQMQIDAKLNEGLLNTSQAKQERKNIANDVVLFAWFEKVASFVLKSSIILTVPIKLFAHYLPAFSFNN